MFFFTQHKKEFVSLLFNSRVLLCTLALVIASFSQAKSYAAPYGPITPNNHRVWAGLVPAEWEDDIITSLTTSLVIISKEPSASGPTGNTDVVLRYTIKNDGTSMDTVNCVQIELDLASQIGVPPFVSMTGSLSAMTGSGFVFGTPLTISDPVYGGLLNPDYDGGSNDSLFLSKPVLKPGQCISIDIPFELGDTTISDPIIISASGSGILNDTGDPIMGETSPLTLLAACESESLACAGKVNISIGPDCKALITLDAVFLNQIVDPNRYSVVVYEGTTLLGDMLDESHVGKDLTYTVFDGCFGGRASCWGEINLENKNFPVPSSTYQEIFCGEEPQELQPLSEIIEQLNNQCFVEITNFTVDTFNDADKCDGGLTGRVIFGEFEIDGWKIRDTIHIDSIFAKPIAFDTIEAPLGGPDIMNAIYVDCDSLMGEYPDPEFIKEYFNSLPGSLGDGAAHAYPHIDKGFIDMPMYSSKETIVERQFLDTFFVNGVEIIGTRIVKDTIITFDTTYITKPYLVPIVTGTICNLTVEYVDEYFPGCVGPESKILRKWKILDWCDSGEFEIIDQWIVIQDNRGPNIELPDTAYVAVTPWLCTAEYQLTAEVEDDCSSIRNLNWSATAGVIDSNNVLTEIDHTDSPVYITLQAIDECGNDSTKSFVLMVIDSTTPVAIGKDRINTTITYDVTNDRGIAKVTAASIDAGSHDSNCGPVTICVLLDEELNNPIRDEFGNQVQDEFGNYIYHALQCDYDGMYEDQPYVICRDAVKMCCELVGEQRVALLVNDESERSRPGLTWTIVNVEDKSFPIVACQDVVVSCGDAIHPDSIGYPTISNGLCKEGSLTYSDEEDFGDCGEGVISRTWLIDGDTSCVQKIIVQSSDSFDPTSIKWPKHYDDQVVNGIIRTCVDDTLRETAGVIDMGSSFICSEDVLDEPVWCKTSCSLLFMTFEDQDVEAGAACKKIIRTWTIIDWCNYDANGNQTDVDNDTFEAVSDENIDGPNPLSNLEDGDICATCDKPSNGNGGDVYFRYTDVDIDGFYTYQQVIKVVDDTPPVVDAPDEVVFEVTGGATFKGDDQDGCEIDVEVSAKVVELCGNIVLSGSSARWEIEIIDEDDTVVDTQVKFGDSVSVSLTGLANTEVTVRWNVSDGCDNEGSAETTVIFMDVIDPTPLCISDLTIATTSTADGTTTIWASDYGNDSYDNCSDVKFFFLNDEGLASSSLSFTCADIPDGNSTIKQLELFVSDEAGNTSSCNVSIKIDDNNNVCIDSAVGMASISGEVMTHLGDMIEEARVSLNGRDNAVTTATGAYAFDDIPMASSYKIDGAKTDDPLNGVSTLDLVLIQRHILALDLFDTPYKVLAADINNDERVSAIDLVQLRRLILGIVDNFPDKQSWRFVDPSQQFDNILSPWPFAKELVIYDLSQDMEDQNLLGVKVGDVSGNAIANSLIGENRSTRDIQIDIEDIAMSKGQTVDVPIRLNQPMDLLGLQFTIETNGAIINGISSASLDVATIDYSLHNNQTLSFAWFAESSLAVKDDLFYLSVTATDDLQISEAISINNNITNALAYDNSLEPLRINTMFSGENMNVIVGQEFELMQNEPNPFRESTTIGFRLPKSDQVRLVISDISGKTVHIQTGQYEAGYNEIILREDELKARGVIYYRLETSGHTETKRMILID